MPIDPFSGSGCAIRSPMAYQSTHWVTTFTMLNLFIAIIVDTMQTMHSADHEAERDHIEEAMHKDTDELGREFRSLREEIGLLREELRQRS